MKNLVFILFAGALILSSCGDKGKTDEKSEEIEKRELTPELEKLINNLSKCESQNTNCEAYNVASTDIQALTDDASKKKVIVGDLVYIIRTGEDAKKQAAAHALNFWTGSRDFRDNATYGKQILEALKTVKDPKDGFGSTGAQIGQVLANWWVNEDKELRSQLISFIKDKNGSRAGRSELLRLVSRDILDEGKMFDALMSITKNKEEDNSIRNYAATSLSFVQEDGNKTKVRAMLETMLGDSELQVAGNAMRGLGYLGSVESFDKIRNTILAHKDDKSWYSYGSGCLTDLIRAENESLNTDEVFALISEMLSDKSIDAYYRSYFVSPLNQLKTPASKAMMAKLKNSPEEDIAKEAERLSKF